LTVESREHAVKAFDAGAVAAVITAMRSYAASEQVQHRCCSVLTNIFLAMTRLADDAAIDEICASFVDAGAIELVVAAMRRHKQLARMQREGCIVLANFATSVYATQRLCDAGVGELLLDLLRSSREASVLEMACGALGNFVRTPVTCARAGRRGAVEAVLNIMGAWQSHLDIQRYGCKALAGLMEGSATNVAAAHRAGAAAAMQAALSAHGENADVKALAADVLALLRQAAAQADAAMAELLASEAAESAAKLAAKQPKRKSKK
jgi:hypothetical protein